MTKDLNEEYRKLEQTRVLLNPTIISNKKGKIWEYFRSFGTVNITNLEKRIRENIILYKAPLLQLHGSNMVNWPTNNGDDIYIDEDFLTNSENADIINHQTTHETLHSLCRVDNKNMLFGRVVDEDNYYLTGISEATTQVFTDDIEGKELSEKDDYLYFVKNIMRVMKNTLGHENLSNQYLNNSTSFEEKFNQITNGKFNDFAFMLDQIYKLNKQKYYSTITEQVEEALISSQNLILEFTSTFVKKVAVNDPDVYTRIKNDFFNKEFLSNLKIEQLNNKIDTK